MFLNRKPKTYIMEIKTDIFNGKPKKEYVEVNYTARQLQRKSPEFDNGCTKLKHISQGICILEKGFYKKEFRILTGTEAEHARKKINNLKEKQKKTKKEQK